MDDKTLEHIRLWFFRYVASFDMDAEEDRRTIEIKRVHTINVEENAELIALKEGMGKNNVLLARLSALLHDIGRFPQYARYRTFNDGSSVNHGELGEQVLQDEGILEGLPGLADHEREAVLACVRYHNAYSMPDIEDECASRLLRVVRDADKLDVWRVMAEYYESAPAERSPAVANHLEDRPTYSQKMLRCLTTKRQCRLGDARVLNDFKLMNLSWAYAVNFSSTCGFVIERGLIERIAATLPRHAEIEDAISSLIGHIRGQSEGSDTNL